LLAYQNALYHSRLAGRFVSAETGRDGHHDNTQDNAFHF
jgi:hypothetical protein